MCSSDLAEDFISQQDRRTLDDDGNPVGPGGKPFELYENITDYIASFEKYEQKQRLKVKKRGLEKFFGDEA